MLPEQPTPLPQMESAEGPIRGYFGKIRKILFSPQEFFASLPPRESLGQVLAFALITHWVGSAIAFLIHMGAGVDKTIMRMVEMLYRDNPGALDQLRQNADYSRFMTWFQGVGAIVLDPFFVLLILLFSSVVLFVFVRLLISENDELGAPRELSFENCMRIASYALTAELFRVIPFVGAMIAWVYGIVLSILGVSALFRVTGGRATAVVLLPKLVLGLFFFILLLGIVFLVVGLVMGVSK
jgi:hypothetical protein